MKTIVVLVGPKGAGKSSLARTLARTYPLGHVEPEAIFLAHRADRSSSTDDASFERGGFAKVAAAVAARPEPIVVTDTTAASAETPSFFAALGAIGRVVVLRLVASEETCRSRLASRDPSGHLPAPPELVARAHARSVAAELTVPVATLDVERSLTTPLFLLPAARAALASLGVSVRAQLPIQRTARTILRPFRPDDRDPLVAMNADPRLAQHLGAPMSPEETDAQLVRIDEGVAIYGLGPSALELPGVLDFAGIVGLWVVTFETPFTPAVEVVWRLAHAAWGHGYVTEAARASLDRARALGIPEIVSFTTPANVRSRAVMERLGMTRDPGGDFDHPARPVGHPHRAQVLYRLTL